MPLSLSPEQITSATDEMARIDKAMRQGHVSKDTARERKDKIIEYLKRNGAL